MKLVHDVRVDPDAPMVSFRLSGVARSYWVDGQGINALRLVSARPSPIVELKLDGGEGDPQTMLFALRDRHGPGHWGAARTIRLDQFVTADPAAAFESFMAQASALLTDLQHDLGAPLAAISRAAHEGAGLLDPGAAATPTAKFADILEQVALCEERMERRITLFGGSAADSAVLPFILAVHAAVVPVRHWMAEAQADMVVSGAVQAGAISLMPGALETLLRYILRSAIEKARATRMVRVVDIVLGEDPAALRVTIRYNMGARHEAAAGDGIAFALAQRMMAQLGGQILMPSKSERRAGLAATLLFPRCESADSSDQLALASSLR